MSAAHTDTPSRDHRLASLLTSGARRRVRLDDAGFLTVLESGAASAAGRFEGAYGTVYDAVVERPILRRAVFRAWGRDTAMHHLDDLVTRAVASMPGAAGGVLLDVPCGGGTLLAPLARAGHRGLVVEADLSSHMLGRAVARHAASCSTVDAVFLQCNALDLPLATGSVDAALSVNGLHVMPDPARFLAELARVLRPSASAFLTTLVSDDSRRHMALMRVARSAGVIPGLAPRAAALDQMARASGFRRVERLGGDGVVALQLVADA